MKRHRNDRDWDRDKKKRRTLIVCVSITAGGLIISGGGPMGVQMTETQYVDVKITGALDANGNKVPIPAGAIETWASDNPAIASIVQSNDGLTGRVSGVKGGLAAGGSATITADGHFVDASGTGHDLLYTLGVTIVGGTAVALDATVGPVQEQPAPTPLA